MSGAQSPGWSQGWAVEDVNQFLALALLGLGAGSIYGLLAQGVVVIHRGSGIVNFAHGGVALVGAYGFYEFNKEHGWPVVLAIAASVAICVLIGIIIQTCVMRPLRESARLTRTVATLGILVIVESLTQRRYGSSALYVDRYLPSGSISIAGAHLGEDRIVILAIGTVVTIVLWLAFRYSAFGRITEAVAASPRVAAATGHSPHSIALVNWALGSALAGLCGCLIAPLTGLEIGQLALLIVPALAAAVVAAFTSFPVAFVSGLAIGIIEAEVASYISSPGWGRAIPFLVVIVVFFARGKALPRRGEASDRLPAVSPGTVRRRFVVLGFGGALVLLHAVPDKWTQAILASTLVALMGLSVVVVTGYAGQLSLASYAFGGVAALVAARFSSATGLSLLPSAAVGAVTVLVCSVAVAIPSFRTRGVSLAIVTLGVGVVAQSVLFNNVDWSGGFSGVAIPPASILGWSINPTQHIDRYATVAMIALLIVVLAVINLRRGTGGRAMLAVRSNERAAATLGISVRLVKLHAFGFSALIAAIAGILMAFRTPFVLVSSGFDAFASIVLVQLVVLGGLGFAAGATVGGLIATGGVLSTLLAKWGALDGWLPLISGVAVIIQLILTPDGLVPGNRAGARRHRRHRAPIDHSIDPAVASARQQVVVEPKVLEVQNLTVRFGGMVAVDNLSLRLEPGRVVGLIGPNGAGKTTVIDAVTGLVPAQGDVVIDGRSIIRMAPHQRAALGLSRSFQAIELFDDLTVRESLAVAGQHYGWKSALNELVKPAAPTLSASAVLAVDEFRLARHTESHPNGLPFGTRRLAGIARSVARAPSILLLDEPGAGLDETEIRELTSVIRRLAAEWGIAVLLVEHHLDMVAAACDHVVVLDHGQFLAAGTPGEMLADPRVRRAYVGDVTETSESRTDAPVSENPDHAGRAHVPASS